ncbi:MAG: pro-sigmaK processing inhibitor BofA family protein [Clostridia bacterium]|nr:pro-sigmaK processing inhibitor BofA family protein [Clostridia bacterium]
MLYVLGAVFAIIALFIFKKSGSFFKAFFTSALGGVSALCAVSAVSYFVPVSVGLNLYSIAFSAFFSVPGVVLLLLSETFIFQ